jgi:UDP-N-acetylmuramate--alanine ligase
MEVISLKKYHFIGIKGNGMSALANVMHDFGETVQGSDVRKNFSTQKELEAKNIPLLSFDEGNIQDNMSVIAGNAFGDQHEEIQRAREKSVKITKYHDFLAELISDYTSIAISGVHGKTTTTGLAAHIFKNIKQTSYLIGDGTGVGVKDGEYFVFEACEYKRHFLSYKPNYAVITNIDFDHPDYFKDEEDVVRAFEEFISGVQKQALGCGDDKNVAKLSENHSILLYGLGEHNNLQAREVQSTKFGTTFDVYYENYDLGTFFVPLHGNHNVLNSLAVIALCLLERLDLNEVRRHFGSYGGVSRGFKEEKIGTNIVIDDYARHPSQIRATIQSVRSKYPEKECVVIFQPYTFTRAKQFLREFSKELSQGENIYFCDIFATAREKAESISIFDLINLTPRSNYLTLNNIYQLHSYNNKVLLFMGAEDIQRYIQAYKDSMLQLN